MTRISPTDEDFNIFLHQLRGERLSQIPPGASTVLSAGCAGRWYFDWFAESYAEVDRHIGVEALQPKPDGLPAGVEWIPSSIGNLADVGDGEVDLVFAGQVIEHVSSDDLVGFITETHRVLRDDGWLVVDSPNSRVTRAIGWEHPEHVAEFTPDEAAKLLDLGGFEDTVIHGIWLCYDSGRHRFLPLDPKAGAQFPWELRVTEAAARPEDSFIWWAEARRGARDPAPRELRQLVFEVGLRDRLLRALRRASSRS